MTTPLLNTISIITPQAKTDVDGLSPHSQKEEDSVDATEMPIMTNKIKVNPFLNTKQFSSVQFSSVQDGIN